MKAEELDFGTFVEIQNVIDKFETPQLHLDIISWLETTQNETDRILQIFRGAGKSHLVSLYVVWRLLKDENTTIMIMSAKRDLAERNSRFIKKVIETNPLTAKLRGVGKWTDTLFFIDRQRNQLNPSVTCSSVESDFVGQHCDLMIIDDLETDKNSVTERQRNDLRSAIAEFMSLAERRTYIGTPHAVDSIYTHLENLDYPLLKVAWTPTIWPNHPKKEFTAEWAERYQKQNPSWKWQSQYLLVPSSPEQALIDPSMCIRYDTDLKTIKVFGKTDAENTWEVLLNDKQIVDSSAYWDPATGLKGRDASTFAVVYKDNLNNVYLHKLITLPPISEFDGFRPQCDAIVTACEELGLARVTVERSVNPTLHTELNMAAKKRNKWIHITSEPRSRSKTEYIASALEPLINSRRFYVHSSVPAKFYSELNDFPNGRNDDHLDSTSGGIHNLRGDVMRIGGSSLIPVRLNAVKETNFNTSTNLARF
ncbi:phage terminase large subunit [Rhodospirillales bacterium]|nr:phage terminase large subunit [Rhodospirillales bacterium]